MGRTFARKNAPPIEPFSLIVEFTPWLVAESHAPPGGAPGGSMQDGKATGRPKELQTVVPKVFVTVVEVPRSLS